ncbi:hypothetical protein GF377_01055 [candidate division GN15 bacterium]|nr:hypothetical protein [candidate division GN15 bacterium]
MSEDIAWLKKTVTELQDAFAGGAGGADAVDMATLMGELEYLRAEVKRLSSATDQHAGKLASLEDVGYAPQSEDDRITALTEKLTAINTALEGYLAASAGSKINSPEVKRGKIRLGGYVHQHFSRQGGDNNSSTFRNRRSRVLLLGPINEYARILIQADFAGSPTLLDAHFTLTPARGLSFTVGQLIAPFSTDYMTSPAALPFVNNAMTAGFAPGRDLGAMASYGFQVDPKTSLKFSLGVFNGTGINRTDANSDKNVIGRIEFGFLGMFTLAPNFNVGYDNGVDSLKQEINSYGASLVWQWKNEVFAAEYLYNELGGTGRSAWYAWGGHSFATGWKLLPVIQPAVRYEQVDPQTGLGDNSYNRLTIGTNFYIDKNFTKIQLNYLINGEEGASVDNNEILMNFQVAF